MKTVSISWLNADKFRILKQIVIVSDRNNNEIELGSIFYTRLLNNEYNFAKQTEENKKNADHISRLMGEYPKQKNYPADTIDGIILDSVRNIYPKSIVKNDSILFSIDLDKLKVLKNRNLIKSTIYFSPEFSEISNLYDYVGKKFDAPSIDINIYSYHKPEILQGQVFYANYDVRSPDVLKKLTTVGFE